MKDTKLYTYNGMMMWLAFLIFRIPLVFVIPYYLIKTIHEFEAVPRVLVTICFINYILISGLNVYWFYKITLGLYKAMTTVPIKRIKTKPRDTKTIPILHLPKDVAGSEGTEPKQAMVRRHVPEAQPKSQD
jgi:hypothetical protein